MLIRQADPERDAAACAAIYEPAVRDGVSSFEETPPTADELARRIARISMRYPWLVAEDDGTVVGYAYGSTHRERAAYRWSVEVTVYIDGAHHRRGVGRALYRELLRRLTDQGYQAAFAGITLPNDASVGLHEAVGFEPVGVYRRIGFKHGAWHDVGWWQLELAPATGARPPEPSPPPTA